MSSASAQSSQLLAHYKLVMCDVKKMSREELEEFADRMRIERNTLLLTIK